ncbi:Protein DETOXIFICATION 48 [Vigna angularis]|uniref:Protein DETOXIFICATION 48 n=1 Tax=Phaseolus angularis TaxID=3914 RepID=A0A8T0LF56_PHAAN|nr:Protein DETOXIFICATION 48 [Vigna angularis]
MTESHPGSSPLLSNYSDGGENKVNGLNDSDTVSERSGSARIPQVVEEIKDLYAIAIPTIATGLLTYGKSAISMHFLGKLGKNTLAGGSLAIGMANITGYSVISGLATALWLNFESLLLLFGQDPTISSIAATYLAYSIPDLLCQSLISPLKIFLRTQGLLENAADNVSTYGIIIQATSFMYNFPYALGLAVSTKVGNELGANRPNKAKASSYTALLCSCFTAIVAMLVMVSASNVWGLIFTDDEAVLSLLSTTLPIVGLCELGNCPQTTICGMLSGSARPALGAKINFLSFYGVGLPVGLFLCFGFHLGLLGLFLGLLSAQIVCAIAMVIALTRTDWKEQANRAKKLTGGMGEINGENNEDVEAAASECF